MEHVSHKSKLLALDTDRNHQTSKVVPEVQALADTTAEDSPEDDWPARVC